LFLWLTLRTSKFDNQTPETPTLAKLASYLFRKPTLEDRQVGSDERVFPASYLDNRIDNTRYNFITFLPLVFFHQFKHFLNLFFLLMALSQFYPPFRVGLVLPQVIPVGVILGIAYSKELWDEWQRRKKDKIYNEALYVSPKKEDH
jgi:phospholipid-translocating ATPase